MIIRAIESPLPGSTKPFIARCETGEHVVIKTLLNIRRNKLLFNEFVAGKLANGILLPWPKVFLATLSESSLHDLESFGVNAIVSDCVATEFVDNLTPIPWPPREGRSLVESNPIHLAQYFNNPQEQSPFYGRALFEIWLFFVDCKYETLFALPNRVPFFLDGSHAFDGDEWNFSEMNYRESSREIPQSPYLEGILNNPKNYSEWLDRIDSVPATCISSILGEIPPSWAISVEQLDFISDLLMVRKRDFVTLWSSRLLRS